MPNPPAGPITEEALADACRAQNQRKAAAPGLSHALLAGIARGVLRALARLLRLTETTGHGLPFLTEGRGVLIPKTTDAEHANDQRPLTLLPAVYILWAKARLPGMRAWLAGWIHPGQVGAVPGRDIRLACLDLAGGIEAARLNDQPLSGCHLDVSKAFNGVHHDMVEFLGRRYGAPVETLVGELGFLRSLTVRFRWGRALGEAWRPVHGLPQGGPLSPLWLLLLLNPWHRAIDRRSPELQAVSCVDDRALHGVWEEVEGALQFTAAYDEAALLANNWGKRRFGMWAGKSRCSTKLMVWRLSPSTPSSGSACSSTPPEPCAANSVKIASRRRRKWWSASGACHSQWTSAPN